MEVVHSSLPLCGEYLHPSSEQVEWVTR